MPRSLFLFAFVQPGAGVWIDFLAQNVQCRVASGIPMNFRHVEKFLWSGACAGMLKHIGQCQCWNVRLRRAADRPTSAVEDGANENTSGSGIRFDYLCVRRRGRCPGPAHSFRTHVQ